MTMRTSSPFLVMAGVGLTIFCAGCRTSQSGIAAPHRLAAAPSRPTATFTPADQANAPLMPDATMTPGATLPVTKSDLCVPGYTKKVRNVPVSVKRQVYAEYGIASHKPGEYEVDHLISLELGGSNSIKNLWPQSYLTQPWNAHVKDALENEMHAEVCKGKLDLATAQHDIATDWIAAYKRYFHTAQPLSNGDARSATGSGGRHRHPLAEPDNSSSAPSAQPASPSGTAAPTTAGGQVWVNLKSGKYFQAGSPYYGHTKQGQYMSEADAQRQGYVAAKGK